MANEITIQDMTNMSVAFAKSGFFGYKNSSESFTLMCLAQANGLHPAKAAERYHIIQGRPAMKAVNNAIVAEIARLIATKLEGFTQAGYELAAREVVKAILKGQINNLKVEY